MIAEHLSAEEVAGIKEGFKVMDINNKGKINIDELRAGLQKLGQQIPDADLQVLMDAVSINVSLTEYTTLSFFIRLGAWAI